MRIIIDNKKKNTKLPLVMRAAIHLFATKGIDGTTVKDIARQAGVAEGALYRHFKSKDELAWNIFAVHLNHFTAGLMARVLSEPSPRARVRSFVRESFAAFEADRELFTYLILSEHKEFRKYPATYPHPGHVALKIVEDGQATGAIRKGDPLLLVSLFVGAVIRVCVTRMYGDLDVDVRESADLVGDAVWDMLRTSEI